MSALPSLKSAMRQLTGARNSLRTAREYARTTRHDERVRRVIEDLSWSLATMKQLAADIEAAESKRRVEARKARAA